jgi:hypothetical protein
MTDIPQSHPCPSKWQDWQKKFFDPIRDFKIRFNYPSKFEQSLMPPDDCKVEYIIDPVGLGPFPTSNLGK